MSQVVANIDLTKHPCEGKENKEIGRHRQGHVDVQWIVCLVVCSPDWWFQSGSCCSDGLNISRHVAGAHHPFAQHLGDLDRNLCTVSLDEHQLPEIFG